MVNFIEKKILLILFISTISLAQTSDNIGSKNTELKSLQVQITKLEGELNTLSKEEKSNLKVLRKMDQQNLLLGKKIKSLEIEEKNKTAIIKRINNNITSLKSKIIKLQKKYSDYLVWTYKQGERSTLRYLLDAESFQEALVRYSYISHIHKANKVDLMNILK